MPVSRTIQGFFLKAFSFLIGTALLLNVLGSFADRVAPPDDWRAQQQRAADLESRSDQIEAITLGNSHSDAIDYSVLHVEGQSMAFAAADLFEVERYADRLAETLPNLKTVFISVSYYSFSRDNATFEPFRTRRVWYYATVPTWTPIHGDTSSFLLGKLEFYTHVLSVVRSDNWKGVWMGMADDEMPVDLFAYDGVTTESAWGKCAHYTAEQLDAHAQDIADRNVTSSRQMSAIHQGLSQDALAALERTVEELQSKGIRVVLFTPTYYKKYNQYFMEQGSSLADTMRQSIGKLQRSYDVEYYDFSQDPDIADQPELFYNSDHLGDCGRKVFSEKLFHAMNGNPE